MIDKKLTYKLGVYYDDLPIAEGSLTFTPTILNYTRQREFQITHDLTNKLIPNIVKKSLDYFDKNPLQDSVESSGEQTP